MKMKINIESQSAMPPTLAEFLEDGAILEVEKDRFLIAPQSIGWAVEPREEGPSFFLPDFFRENERPWRIFSQHTVMDKTELIEWLQPMADDQLSSREWIPPEPADLEFPFHWIQKHIESGELKKAVPVVFATSAKPLSTKERARALMNALLKKRAGWLYGFWCPQEGGILGATPELLFEQSGAVVETMALAGTRKENEDLLEVPKERAEHGFVVEDLLGQLKPLGEVHCGDTEAQDYGGMQHLHTPIRATTTTKLEMEDLVDRLHPTPALGVFPRSFDFKRLKEMGHRVRRGRFGAPFGVRLRKGESLAVVAIRNLQWDDQEAWITSGCGIVADSELESEWQELTLKRESVRHMFGV